MLQAVYPLQEQSAKLAPTNILAVLVSALECSDSYEITEHRGELFIAARARRPLTYRDFPTRANQRHHVGMPERAPDTDTQNAGQRGEQLA